MDSKNKELIETLRTEGIHTEAVLNAMAKVDRINFVTEETETCAYINEALPIKSGQTISQPYVVARMTELVLRGKSRLKNVLEIGTGSGYQAAVLSHLTADVYTIERIQVLYEETSKLLQKLGYKNIHTKYGDGYSGWSKHSPFEAIMITAAVDSVPQQLLLQLDRDNGRMIVPVSSHLGWQRLRVITRRFDEYTAEEFDAVMFVPMLPGLT